MTKSTFPTLLLSFFFVLGTGSMTNAESYTLYDAEVFIGGPPSATICGKTKGEVLRNDLLNMKSIELRGCVATAKVTGFKMTVVQTNKDGSDKVIILSTEEDTLTENMKGLIKGIPIGSKIYFEEINVVDANGKKYDIEPVVVTIG